MQSVRATARRFLMSAFAAALLAANAAPARAAIDPCRAFRFYTQTSGDWKTSFAATLEHYQALAALTGPTAEGARYERLLDSLLDCYSLRQSNGPSPALSPANAYETLLFALHSFPTGRLVVDAGLNRVDLEALKEIYPSLEYSLSKAKSVPKTYVTGADAALFDWLHFLAEVYPSARFERDRRRWHSAFNYHFDRELGATTPAKAFQKAYEQAKSELAVELEPLRRRFEVADGDSEEIRLILNRKDLFSYLFIDGLLSRELLQAGWDRFGESSAAMATHARPGLAWVNWLKALQQEGEKLQTTLREHPAEVVHPVLEKVLLLRKRDPKALSPTLVQSQTDQLLASETDDFFANLVARAGLSSVSPVTTKAVLSLLQPDFSRATTLQEVVRVLRGYSGLAHERIFDPARRSLYPASADNAILQEIEFSPYAIENDLHGPALAEQLLTELASFSETEQRRQNAEAFRRVIAAMTLGLNERTPDEDVARVARGFAAVRGAKAQIDFFGSDYFFAERFAAVKSALGYRKADLFRKIYRETVLQDCKLIWKPFRRAWLFWES